VKNLTSLAFNFPLSSAGNISLGVSRILLSGLNTWNEFSLLSPVPGQDYLLSSVTETDLLNGTLTFYINASIFNQGFAETGKIEIDLTNNNLNTTLQVALNSTVAQFLASHIDKVLS
jgi:hypothetical protein